MGVIMILLRTAFKTHSSEKNASSLLLRTKFVSLTCSFVHSLFLYSCQAVTRIIWLDMTLHWKLIPRCLFVTAPELFPDPS